MADIRNCEILQQPSFTALKSSAESGCDLCGLSYAALRSQHQHSIATIESEDKDLRYIDMLCRGRNPARTNDHDTRIYLEGLFHDYYECDTLKHKVEKVQVRVGEFSPGQNTVEAYLRLGADPGSLLTKYFTGRIPSLHPGDTTSMSRIQSWVQTCDKKHEMCAFLSADQAFPNRILDIKGKPIVRLNNGVKGRYVALSYCWGKSGQNVLLTSSTLAEFTSTGIDMHTLPKTIRDAIVVCRNLGVYYLWVDALCIVQEESNSEDFKAEAPRMFGYYRNAYLTLIAGSAQDCADGFLNKRHNPEAAPCEIVYDRKIFPSDNDMTGFVKVFMPSSQDRGPIQKRAWTFQESMLSQRSLIYGLEQFYFVCPIYSIFEDGDFQKISNPSENLPSDTRAYPNVHHLVKHDNKAEVKDYAYKLWYGSIYTYTSRQLSNPLDKLAAIAGYANLFQKVVKCRYMYGLWEDNLLKELFWNTQRPWISSKATGPITRELGRAPSWSWASIDGPLFIVSGRIPRELLKDPKNFRLKILSYDNVPCSFDPIREHVIRDNLDVPKAFQVAVRGVLREVWHVPIFLSGSSGFMVFEDQTPFDIKGFAEFRKENHLKSLDREHMAFGTWDTYDDFEKKKYWGRHVYALLLISVAGLLLTNVDGKYYRRIGYFWRAREELFTNIQPEDIILI